MSTPQEILFCLIFPFLNFNHEDLENIEMKNTNQFPNSHTNAWILQTWLSFLLSVSAMSVGIFYLPVDAWIKGYLAMGMLFSIGSTISLAKTTRDIEESKRFLSRIDEAKLEKFLAEYDPFKP